MRPKHISPPVVPAGLADVVLVDAATSAAVGDMSGSWWLARVASGDAPQPVIRQPRCTRWKLSDVRKFWEAFAETGANPDAAGAVIEKAKKASLAARAKRGQLAQAGVKS